MIITVTNSLYGPFHEQYHAFWGEEREFVDFWGAGATPEEAVRDLLDNYDIPEFSK